MSPTSNRGANLDLERRERVHRDGRRNIGYRSSVDANLPGAAEIENATAVPRGRRAGNLALIFLASMVVGLTGHLSVERLAYRGRVLPGTSALGVPLEKLDEQGARAAVRGLAAKVSRLTGHVDVRGRKFEVHASDVGLTLDVEETVHRALAFGREGSWLHQIGQFLARPFSRERLPIAVRLDPDHVEAALGSFEREALGEPELEGAVAYTDRVVPIYPREGLAIVRRDAAHWIESALVGRDEAVPLPVEPRKPLLSRADVDRAVAEGVRLVGKPVRLRDASGEGLLELSPAELGSALRARVVTDDKPRLELFFDRDAVRAAIDRSRPALERPARDATFAIGPKGEISIVPSGLGRRLDEETTFASIATLAKGEQREGVLELRNDVLPALTTEQAEGLHIRGLVSRYTTPFPCCEARVKNIERMAALVDGSIVRPGEIYSVNTRSGPRTPQNGFVAGPTIVEGEMEMTVGGGVSQFATTLFNAAFDGGYEIVQRQPHTYWFPRYPEGHDATLGFPLPDLIFRNDSDAGILIKATVGKTSVRVELYGDNGGRRVERHVSSRFDVTRPETVIEPNDDLAPDETKVKFGGSIGWSLNASRVITYPDGQRKEEHRKVTYSPRARRIEAHSCKIPEGAPGYTGVKCPKVESLDGGT